MTCEAPIHQCAHCGVEGEHQGLQVKTLTYFADFEDLYCKHCIKKALSINGSCDKCKALDTKVHNQFLMLFGGSGLYCQRCRLNHANAMMISHQRKVT